MDINGSTGSGSGTIVRYAIALCSLVGTRLHLTNIRAARPKPGLQHQHLKVVEACSRMSTARVAGVSLGSPELTYEPGGEIRGGYYEWDIGTAGSTSMLAMTILLLACFADKETTCRISGGLFQDFAPSAHHMQHVLFPTLRKMGICADLKIVRPGYVPRGAGIIEITAKPLETALKPLILPEQGQVKCIRGIALSSHLRERKVSERMAQECQKVLRARGYKVEIEGVWDETSLQEGASLAVWAETDSGCLIGSDRAGKRGRSSEEIGRYVAESLLEDIASGATVDRYSADQLLIYAALADGVSEYLVPRITDHVSTSLWLIEQFGAEVERLGHQIKVRGIGLTPTQFA